MQQYTLSKTFQNTSDYPPLLFAYCFNIAGSYVYNDDMIIPPVHLDKTEETVMVVFCMSGLSLLSSLTS